MATSIYFDQFNIFPPKFTLKGGSSDLGKNFYKNTKRSSLYSQGFLIFIHKTPVADVVEFERHLSLDFPT